MTTSLYLLSAVITIVLILTLSEGVGAGLLIAWFAWCGGVLFEKLRVKYITKGN